MTQTIASADGIILDGFINNAERKTKGGKFETSIVTGPFTTT